MQDNAAFKNESFKYEYSSEKAKEVDDIVNKYVAKEDDKLTQIKKLDEAVERRAAIKAVTIGVIGALIMGAGMSIIMKASASFFVTGIVVGLIGMAVMAAAFPIYKGILKKEREAAAPQILALSQDIKNEL